MSLSLHQLVQKYNIHFKGVLHVGAHECEEIMEYESYISRDKILWVEAIPEKVELVKNKFPNILIENATISNKNERVRFNVANNIMSSSMLELGLHAHYHPQINYIYSFETDTTLLKDIIPKYNIDFNFLTLDIQGAELKALKSMEDYLPKIDYIMSEVNASYVYKDCALVSELDEYLGKFGLTRVETNMSEFDWGDAFYIRSSLLKL